MASIAGGLAEVTNLAVIGPGLLGGSIGLALRSRGFTGRILGVSRRQATLDTALARGCIDEGTQDVAPAGACDLIVLATPLSTFSALLQSLSRHLGACSVITDVGSTKASVVQAARAALTPEQFARFVPAHPMAGSEQQGPEHARADLLAGKPCVLTPENETDAAAVQLVERLWLATGMRLLRMTAVDHDARTAVISHLPHLASVALTEVVMAMGGLEVASTGFRDTSRLASSNPTIRVDILTQNRQAIVRALDACIERLQAWRNMVEYGDQQGLADRLDQAKRFRDAWIHGDPTG